MAAASLIMFDNGGMATARLDCVIEPSRASGAPGDNHLHQLAAQGHRMANPRLAPVTKITCRTNLLNYS